MQPEQDLTWRSPEEIVEIGFRRSRVVMMNEAHDGLKRCIRTRQIGRRILPAAHQAGVRHLAMEALDPAFAERANRERTVPDMQAGYLSQPEMRSLIQAALELGWTLVPYEADHVGWLKARYGADYLDTKNIQDFSSQFRPYRADLLSQEYTDWREEQQSLNIIEVLQTLPVDTKFLVWSGNSHHSKRGDDEWQPMGYQFQRHSGIDPFVIDQTLGVKFDFREDTLEGEVASQFLDELSKHAGTAGFLVEATPPVLTDYAFQELGVDALLFSTQNEME